jgi:plastocyanin
MKRTPISVLAMLLLCSFSVVTSWGNAQEKSGSTEGQLLAADAGDKDNDAEGNSGTIKGRVTVADVKDKQNVLVYVVKVEGGFPIPKDPAEMDQLKLTFIPRVLPIVKGTTVKFQNSDSVLHNVFWRKSADGSYAARNLGTWGKGGTKDFTFDKEGEVTLLCNVHPEMEGHIVVLQNPFFTMVGEDGSYEIKGVPAGKHTVKAWYPNPKKLKSKTADVTVSAGKTASLDFSLGRK